MSDNMKWIKLNRDCAFGKKGAVVQVHQSFAESRVKKGHAEYAEEPESQIARREHVRQTEEAKRPTINNKAMSASG